MRSRALSGLRALLAAGASLVLITCGPKIQVAPHQRPDEPIPVKEAVWQQAWVDPNVVYSDSIFTLIRASRIDSFLVAPGKLQAELPDLAVSSKPVAGGAGALKFQIPANGCRISVSLSGLGVQLSPLLTQTMTAGYYKLTCDLSRTDRHQFPSGPYRVSASFCGLNRGGTLLKP